MARGGKKVVRSTPGAGPHRGQCPRQDETPLGRGPRALPPPGQDGAGTPPGWAGQGPSQPHRAPRMCFRSRELGLKGQIGEPLSGGCHGHPLLSARGSREQRGWGPPKAVGGWLPAHPAPKGTAFPRGAESLGAGGLQEARGAWGDPDPTGGQTPHRGGLGLDVRFPPLLSRFQRLTEAVPSSSFLSVWQLHTFRSRWLCAVTFLRGGTPRPGPWLQLHARGSRRGQARRGRQQLPHPKGWPSHSSQARGRPSSQEPWGSPQRLCRGAGGPPAPQRGLAGTYRTRISFQSSSELPICFPVFLVSLGSPSPATST